MNYRTDARQLGYLIVRCLYSTLFAYVMCPIWVIHMSIKHH